MRHPYLVIPLVALLLITAIPVPAQQPAPAATAAGAPAAPPAEGLTKFDPDDTWRKV